jgi:hypothetical protein
MVIVIVLIMIAIPIAFRVPTVVFAAPPAVFAGPAALALFVQVMPPTLGLAAMFSVISDRVVQSGFRFFDPMPAFIMIIRICTRSADEQQRCA